MIAFLRPAWSASRLVVLGTALSVIAAAAPINRQALVTRHTVRVERVDPESPLSVGNGDFAFTVDATGLQTFETLFHQKGIPLETLSTWAWHSFPNFAGLRIEDAMQPYPFHGRTIQYAARQDSPAGAYFRENPHPIPLGQISLLLDGRPPAPEDLKNTRQTLDLWSGAIRSTYELAGESVSVETVAHDERSAIGVRLTSPLLRNGRLAVRIRFPYSHQPGVRNKPALDWTRADRHRTATVQEDRSHRVLERTLDASRYFVELRWEPAAQLSDAGPHEFRLTADGAGTLAFTCEFAPSAEAVAGLAFESVRQASAEGWMKYWTTGGVIDFSGSQDPRATELERRTVLSQYLMRVNYAGSFPPSEDGLTNITWFGKHNSEMYYWHAAQFHAWGHTELLEKGLSWYRTILPSAKAEAAAQGLAGARWPKMAGIDGRPSPGTINPFIIWNQPNPIALCELVHRARPTRETLERYRDVVFESAHFLASFAQLDARGRYVLGPPVKNVSEKSGENHTQNPTFELAYWHYGLKVAQAWRERLGLKPDPRWADVLARLAPLPVSANGLYLEIETEPDIYRGAGRVPTSMLMALGFMPKTALVDRDTMRRTFDEVNRRNDVDRWASWAMGEAALTAARLGQGDIAVRILTNTSPATRFMNAGHVRRPKEPQGCPAYFPVNASFLLAVATMAAGWDGAPDVNVPGFPQDGTWTVRHEGLNRMP